MHNLAAAKRAGVRLSVYVVTEERQRGSYAGPGIPQVRPARQARPPQGDGAKPVVHRQHSLDAKQGAARPIDAGQVVRQAAPVKQEPLLHSRFRNKADGSMAMNPLDSLSDRMTSDFRLCSPTLI